MLTRFFLSIFFLFIFFIIPGQVSGDDTFFNADPTLKVQLTADEKQWLAQHPEVRIAFDGDYAPYSFIDDKGDGHH